MFNQYRNTNANVRNDIPMFYKEMFNDADLHLKKLLEVRKSLSAVAFKAANSGMTSTMRVEIEGLQNTERMVLLDIEKDNKAISLIRNMEEVKRLIAENTNNQPEQSPVPSAPPEYSVSAARYDGTSRQ